MSKSRSSRWRRRWSLLREMVLAVKNDPDFARKSLRNWPMAYRGHRFAAALAREPVTLPAAGSGTPAANPLWDYFAGHSQGNGIFKWTHYFAIYHRHLARFVGQPTCLAEVGVLGGGSLEMWAQYLGDQCQIFGIDIQPECKKYERERIQILIGDQQDRAFWATFKQQVKRLDVLIDDGGHQPEQQIVTLEELLPHLQPGGVYICEDILGIQNSFVAYAAELVSTLNQACRIEWGETRCVASSIQRAVHSIYFYPYMLVIEKHIAPPEYLTAVVRGTEWPAYLPIKR